MPSPKIRNALILLCALLLLAAVFAGVFLYRHKQPLAASDAGAAPNILSLLPGDAPVLAFLDAKALKTTQNSSLQAIANLLLPAAQQDRDYLAFVQNTGFDYTRDLDRAALALWPGNFSKSSASGQNSAVAVADGKFDSARIEAYALRAGGHTLIVSQRTVYEVPGDPPVSFEFLSPTRVKLASGAAATRLLTATIAPPPAPVQERINRVAAASFFAVARTDNLPPSFYANFQNPAQLLALLHSVQGLTAAGQPDAANFDLTLDAECDSMKNALTMATLLEGFRMFGSTALADPKSRGQITPQQAAFLSALLSHIKITPQDNWVRLSIGFTPAMLSEAAGAR